MKSMDVIIDPDSSIESSAPYDATLQDPSTSTIVTETLPESTTTATCEYTNRGNGSK